MTLEQIALIAQIVGVVVVAATLIYLTIQVRQGAQQMRSESRQAQLANDQTGVYKFVEFPNLGRIASQDKTPTVDEKTQLFFWMIGQLRAREFEYLQYKSGAMTKDAWETYRGVIFFVPGTPRTRALWPLCKVYFNREFVHIVDDMIRDTPPIRLWDELSDIQ
ncbi:MAG: hypothetical protein AAFQ29_03315 [Pseudomonadota bacterium]